MIVDSLPTRLRLATSQLICTTCPQPKALLNVAWTSKGLNKLNVFDNNLDPFFNMGQVPDANALGDNNPPQNWVPGLYMDKTDGVFLIASKDWAPIDSLLAQILSWLGSSIVEVHRLKGAHRTGAWEGHEHFGFLDGIVRGFILVLTWIANLQTYKISLSLLSPDLLLASSRDSRSFCLVLF